MDLVLTDEQEMFHFATRKFLKRGSCSAAPCASDEVLLHRPVKRPAEHLLRRNAAGGGRGHGTHRSEHLRGVAWREFGEMNRPERRDDLEAEKSTVGDLGPLGYGARQHDVLPLLQVARHGVVLQGDRDPVTRRKSP